MTKNSVQITKKGKGKARAKKEKRQRKMSKSLMWALTVLAAIVISLLAYFVFVNPQLQRVGPGREFDVQAAQRQLDARKDYLNQLRELENNYELLDEESISLVEKILPSNKDIPELFAQLEVMARQSGIILEAIQVNEVDQDEPGDIKELRVELKLSTPLDPETKKIYYGEFKEFIRVLETHNRIMDIDTFGFQADDESQSVIFTTYYLD